MFEAFLLPIPTVRIEGLENLCEKRAIHESTNFLQRCGLTGGEDLNRKVAQSGGFSGPRKNSPAGRVGSELV